MSIRRLKSRAGLALLNLRNQAEDAAARWLPLLDDRLQDTYVRSLRLQARTSTLLVPLPQLDLEIKHRWTSGGGQSTYDRWSAVADALRPGPGFALDIGSHAGFFSFALAGRGYHVLGYEPDTRWLRIAYTAAERARVPSVAFMPLALDEENVTLLPEADVVLLLSVLHNWVQVSDFETAQRMLGEVWRRTRHQLFFELPNTVENSKVREWLPDMGATPDGAARFVEGLLRSLPAAEVRLLGHFPTDFRGELESRHLFVVNRSSGD